MPNNLTSIAQGVAVSSLHHYEPSSETNTSPPLNRSQPSTDDLLGAGYALVLIPLGCKRPIGLGWNIRENVITSPADASVLQGKNIGVAHAYCTPTPTCALDIDNYRAATHWLASKGIKLKPLIFKEDAVVTWSGKKNSIKLIYRLPPELGVMQTTTVRDAKNGMILEFRCGTANGRSVQDVLPPSVHPSGSTYQWMGDGSPLALPTIPSDLLNVWIGLLEKDVKSPSKISVRHPSMEETPRNIASVWEIVSKINADCDYETYRTVIWGLESLGWNDVEEIQRTWSLSAPDRFEEKTLQNLRASFKTGDRCITFGSLVYIARKVGGTV